MKRIVFVMVAVLLLFSGCAAPDGTGYEGDGTQAEITSDDAAAGEAADISAEIESLAADFGEIDSGLG